MSQPIHVLNVNTFLAKLLEWVERLVEQGTLLAGSGHPDCTWSLSLTQASPLGEALREEVPFPTPFRVVLWLCSESWRSSGLCLLGIITDGIIFDQQNLDHQYFKRARIFFSQSLFVQHVFQFSFINSSYNQHNKAKYSFTSRFLNKWKLWNGLCLKISKIQIFFKKKTWPCTASWHLIIMNSGHQFWKMGRWRQLCPGVLGSPCEEVAISRTLLLSFLDLTISTSSHWV